ncbi:hypothetical protein NPIL_99881 [Nephila pilipes]|uniref:Uncharacterized protein n=1 Tax=Nephila pilipes TaxID=299642 RepID=A0A8X6NRA4_NEPPI|nr:hypothetical protein NPIL_99881 [Nephila pilipes]
MRPVPLRYVRQHGSLCKRPAMQGNGKAQWRFAMAKVRYAKQRFARRCCASLFSGPMYKGTASLSKYAFFARLRYGCCLPCYFKCKRLAGLPVAVLPS